jgi:hypothetical protein
MNHVNKPIIWIAFPCSPGKSVVAESTIAVQLAILMRMAATIILVVVVAAAAQPSVPVSMTLPLRKLQQIFSFG